MTMNTSDTPETHILPQDQKTYFGHPAGLFILFFTEMWERFSYYGMRALLMLYMTTYLIKDPEKAASVLGFNQLRHLIEMGFGPLETRPLASQLYGLYTAFVYLSPFFGGILADKVWGRRKSVYLGGLIMAVGHFLMAFEHLFLLALFFIILGNGCFKPNISTQVGELYEQGDTRRDGAFTIFYMGINLGSMFAPLVCGTLGQVYGWHYGFTAAGFGMLLGLMIYHFGRKLLPIEKQQILKLKGLPNEYKGGLYALKTILSFFGVAVGFFIILILPVVMKAILVLALIIGVSFAVGKLEKEDKSRVIALIFICLATIVFWSIYEQQGNTLQLWADDKTDWNFFGIQIPSTWYQFFNPAMIFIFAPFLDIFWNARAKKGKTSSSVRKMGLGSVFTGIAFIIMLLAAKVVGPGTEKGSILWLLITTWIFTMGELYISPIGLSLFTKVAPPKLASMMMGVWFISNFLGNYLSGYIGSFYDRMPKDNFFLLLCVMGVAVGGLYFLAEGKMKKLIGDV